MYGQKKKPTKVPAPPPIVMAPEAKKPQSPLIQDHSKQCFVYISEIPKDSLVAVTENLLEYFPSGNNARMVITTYQYDPKIKQQTDLAGDRYALTQKMQFIEGKYTLQNGILTMIPDKKDTFETRRFQLVKKPTTQTLLNLRDEDNHLYKKGKCIEPMISL